MNEIEKATGEIVMYQPDETIRLEVRMEDETVWLTQAQMAELFQRTPQNITIHIRNAYHEGEIEKAGTYKDYLQVQKEGTRHVTRHVKYYNLDVIISVGYRVKSKRGTEFRKWALQILKDYLLRGYVVNQQKFDIQREVVKQGMEIQELKNKVDFFVRTSLHPVEGIFYDGQIFDAYTQIVSLIKQARKNIVLVDNYIDETTLTMLSRRGASVSATIYTRPLNTQQQLDVQRHNLQYAPITINICQHNHDRFLIIDGDVYLFGASLKDAGKRLFAYIKMHETNATNLLAGIR